MKKATEQNLIDASDCLEAIIKELHKLSLEDKVDIAARNRAIAKNAEAIDKAIKEEIKTKLKGKAGVLLGEIFKAKLAIVTCDRLDQQALKADKPEVHSAYVRTDYDKRVTFEPR